MDSRYLVICAMFFLILIDNSISGEFVLRIAHTNDMHARFDQTSRQSGKCGKKDAASEKCVGGFARVATALKQAREQAASDSIPLLTLNAGDTFQGTIWYTVHKWNMTAKMINMLNFDVLSLGNHEFDDDVPGLVPFLNNITSPVVACNLNLNEEPLLAPKIRPSITLERSGKKIGIVGYLTPETKMFARTGKVQFYDDIEFVNKEASRLKEAGINIIIALGHSGYEIDLKMAEVSPDIDIIVGGHSHSFLYTGNETPDSQKPVGPYPTVVRQKSGRKVVVVQAYAYTKYLGLFNVTFDENDEVLSASGSPALLDNSFKEDPEVLQEITRWQSRIDDLMRLTLGHTRVVLVGRCRMYECNLGNFIADAFVDYVLRSTPQTNWTSSATAIINGGSVRVPSISVTDGGKLTREDVFVAMPFNEQLVVIKIQGKHLRDALELSVARYDGKWARGEFLQFSGLRVEYNLENKPFSRVSKVMIRCSQCPVPTFEPLNETNYYPIIMSRFLQEGGDNYTMFTKDATIWTELDKGESDIVGEFIQQRGIIYPGLEERIQFSNTKSMAVLLNKPMKLIVLIVFLLELIRVR